MVLTDLLLFALGAALLIAGAESLVRGASRLAIAGGVSPLVVGLTVVAFGTSAPELAITVGAAFSGEAELALGNVVGSNIFNFLFILGVTAAAAPLVVSQQIVRLDVPLVIASSLLVAGLSLDGRVGRIDGAFLSAGLAGYLWFLLRQSRTETPGIVAEYDQALHAPEARRSHLPGNLLFVAAGLALLVLGARWLVTASVAVAQGLGVSELVIGLTIVAAGTSLPEVATSVVASLRGERDIAVGNVVGSNLFNLFAVLGLGSLVAPAGIPVPSGVLTFDIPVMIAAAIAVLPISFSGYLIARWEGFLLAFYYAAYTAYIVLEAVRHPLTNGFGAAMLYFVLPLTAITIAVVSVRYARSTA